jgi:hypothetical protein
MKVLGRASGYFLKITFLSLGWASSRSHSGGSVAGPASLASWVPSRKRWIGSSTFLFCTTRGVILDVCEIGYRESQSISIKCFSGTGVTNGQGLTWRSNFTKSGQAKFSLKLVRERYYPTYLNFSCLWRTQLRWENRLIADMFCLSTRVAPLQWAEEQLTVDWRSKLRGYCKIYYFLTRLSNPRTRASIEGW